MTTVSGLMLATPKEFIMVLGGLAMLRVLQGAFLSSFGGGKFTLGALVSLLVTVTDLGILNIGAAFWGLVAGFVVSWLMLRFSGLLVRLLRPSGIEVISRILGLLLAAIAVQLVADAIFAFVRGYSAQ